MDAFGKLVKKQKELNGFDYLEEEGGAAGGAMNPTGMPSDEAPMATQQAPNASMDSTPSPEQGAGQTAIQYDKPYQDLATLLYKALRMNYDDLGSGLQRKFMAKQPDNIESDEQGASVFKAFEDILRIEDTPDLEDNSVEGGGFTGGSGVDV